MSGNPEEVLRHLVDRDPKLVRIELADVFYAGDRGPPV